MEKDIKKESTELNHVDDSLDTSSQKLACDNDITVTIKSRNDGILFDEDCCTVINIILNNEGKIATSFLGVHNEQIIKSLMTAQKIYFKALKKTLKEERKKANQLLENKEENSENADKPEEEIIDTAERATTHTVDNKGKCIVKKKAKENSNNKDDIDTVNAISKNKTKKQ